MFNYGFELFVNLAVFWLYFLALLLCLSELVICNLGVVGSNPTRGSEKEKFG